MRPTQPTVIPIVFAIVTACSGTTRADYGAKQTLMPPLSAWHPSGTTAASTPLVSSHIKYVVVVIQENRSFENLFEGFPGADTQSWGTLHDGTRANLQPIGWNSADISHSFATSIMDWDNGAMDKFDLNVTNKGTIGQLAYVYMQRNLIAPYWDMAKRYVLTDHMFPTMFGESFTAHLTLVAGTSDLNPSLSEVDTPSNVPWGCDAPRGTFTHTVNAARAIAIGPFPCLTQFRTMADTLDAARIPWREYAPALSNARDFGRLWTAFDAVKSVRYGADWDRIISPPQQILSDVARGKLAKVTWVIPDALWSDHPGTAGGGTYPYGPSWVASVVNAIGNSKFWRSTAIVVVWDDYGGFYDHLPPPQRDFRGLGIRVGCLIISPYVKPHVSHTVYEFGSILKFIEQAFNLPPVGPPSAGYTDTRAKSIRDSFDFSMRPRAFKTVPAPYPPTFFINHAPSLRAPDDD